MDTAKIEIKPFFISIAVILCLETAANAATTAMSIHPMVFLGFLRLVEICSLIIISISCGQGLSSIGLSSAQILPGIKKGLIWSLCIGSGAAVVSAVLLAMKTNPVSLVKTPMPDSPGNLTLFLLVGTLVAPVAEEVFFRGILFGFIRRWGAVAAIVFSSLIFVLIHPTGSGLPVVQIVGGFLFAVSYETGKSLMVPIVIHVLGNASIFYLSFMYTG
jgi:membrane protease YdiL (CAAX protease family)